MLMDIKSINLEIIGSSNLVKGPLKDILTKRTYKRIFSTFFLATKYGTMR